MTMEKSWLSSIHEGDKIRSNYGKGKGKTATCVGLAGPVGKAPRHSLFNVYFREDAGGWMFHYEAHDLLDFIEEGSIILERKEKGEAEATPAIKEVA